MALSATLSATALAVGYLGASVVAPPSSAAQGEAGENTSVCEDRGAGLHLVDGLDAVKAATSILTHQDSAG